MQISKPLNIDPSLLLISACASAAEGPQRAGLQTVGADEISEPAPPYLQASRRPYPVGSFDKRAIDAGHADGQRHRQDDEASG